MPTTTVKISKRVRKRLTDHRGPPRQSHGKVIDKDLDLVEEDEREFTDAFRADIAAGRADARARRVYTTRQLREALGL